jgi:DivIVA domain-containing protein
LGSRPSGVQSPSLRSWQEVDDFLEAIRDTFLGVRQPPLTADEVRGKQFSTTRLQPGYDEKEVDVFLDEVEARLRRRCAECGALVAEATRACAGCGAPPAGQRPAGARPGRPADAPLEAGNDRKSPGQVGRCQRHDTAFLGFFVILCATFGLGR